MDVTGRGPVPQAGKWSGPAPVTRNDSELHAIVSQPPSITAGELANMLAGELEGDGAAVIRGVASLDAAGETDLSWIASEKYLPAVAATRAAAVLAPRGWVLPAGRTLIRVADPDVALCDVLRALGPRPPQVAPGVHPTAVVADDALVEGAAVGPHVVVGRGARVGAGTQLHAGVYVGEQTRIGRDCVLYANVVVRERVTVGDRVVIHSNATIGADGFGYLQRDGRHLKIPQIGTVRIEDDVEIGANSAVDRARTGVTRIGRGTKIDNLVQIGHNCDIGEACIIISQCGLSGSVTLGAHAMLCGQVGVSDHVRIGAGAVIGAQSGVISEIPDGAAVIGSPAGTRRDFFRAAAYHKRFPKLLEQLRDLSARVEKLESATHD